jgi:hypothetical protein
MRQFASSGFRIWNLSPEAKLVYTGFGVFALLAIAVSMMFYEDLVGPRSAGIAGYYAGEEAQAPKATSSGGPKIELEELRPDPKQPQRITVAVTYRKLLEVTHFHLFTVPVFLLIIAHLFMLTGLAPATKMAWIATGFASSLVHLAAPWLIRYAGAGWSFLYATTGALMALSLSVMTVYPIVVMWKARPTAAPSTATSSTA